jgi:hypothetical protein
VSSPETNQKPMAVGFPTAQLTFSTFYYFAMGNIFNSDVAKRWGFFAHHSHVDTSHKEEKKLCILPHETHAVEERKESRRSKKEKRKEEGRRRKKPTIQAGQLTTTHLCWVSPAVGLRDPSLFRQRVCFGRGVVFRFESRFFSIGSGCRKDLAVALSHLAASRRQATETHGWVSPAVGLGFFFFFFPSGGFLFLG